MRAHAPRETIVLPAELHIAAGTCYAVFAYDVGLSIALEECERRITALTQRATLRHKHRAPDYFEYRPAPVRVRQEADPLPVGGYRTLHCPAIRFQLLIALPVGQGGDDLDRPLDDALHLSQGLLNHPLQRGKGLGRLHPVIADPLEAF